MRILQVSCSYFPERIGGTETYVRDLSRGLLERGHDVFVCYIGSFVERAGPAFRVKNYLFDGIPVYALEKNAHGMGTRDIYFQDQNKMRPAFMQLLDELKPDLVHFHYFSPTDIVDAAEVAKERGLATLLTYHTPMMTCGQGEMLFGGSTPCEGQMSFSRCVECIQVAHSIPHFLARCWARLPLFLAFPLGRCVSFSKFKSPLATWLQLPWLESRRQQKIRFGLGLIDYFVAVCDWVRSLLVLNGIKEEKIFLSRQGVESLPASVPHQANHPLRCVFVGRIVFYKGLEVLLNAVSLLDSDVAIEVLIYGQPHGSREEGYVRSLRNRFSREKRIQWKGRLEPEAKIATLQQADVVVVPSLWKETGPLVLLEAWAAGVPVIGSNRAGIAELLVNGRGGILFEPGNFKELAGILRRIAQDETLLESLKKTIPVPKTMREVAVEMEGLYKRVSRNQGVSL